MKSIIITSIITAGMCASIPQPEVLNLPLIVDKVDNTFNVYFNKNVTECLNWEIKLNHLNKFDKDWLNQHGGKLLILTEKNMIIKIEDETYKPNKVYKVVENGNITIFNNEELIFKTDYDSFKNMMSYSDNEYSFMYIPITIKFYNCTY